MKADTQESITSYSHQLANIMAQHGWVGDATQRDALFGTRKP